MLPCLAAQAALAQAWPWKTIRYVVPFPPAGVTDILARIVADKLTPALTDLMAGQVSVMCDNLPSSIAYIRSGRLRAIAITTAARYPGRARTLGI